MNYGGAVAACGLAQGMDLPASVAPFILRGVSLLGVDSVMCPKPRREQAWARLAQDLDMDKLESLTSHITLDEVIAAGADIISGKVRGRIVVDIISTPQPVALTGYQRRASTIFRRKIGYPCWECSKVIT